VIMIREYAELDFMRDLEEFYDTLLLKGCLCVYFANVNYNSQIL